MNPDGTLQANFKPNVNTWHQSADGKNRWHFGNNSHTYFGSPSNGYYWRNGADQDIMRLENGNLYAGQFCIGGTCINESHLQLLTGARPITLFTGANGHHADRFIHTHNDGVMRVADPVYKTSYTIGIA